MPVPLTLLERLRAKCPTVLRTAPEDASTEGEPGPQIEGGPPHVAQGMCAEFTVE